MEFVPQNRLFEPPTICTHFSEDKVSFNTGVLICKKRTDFYKLASPEVGTGLGCQPSIDQDICLFLELAEKYL